MKTTMLQLAMTLFTVASLSSPASADPTFSRSIPYAAKINRAATPVKPAMSCPTDACCATKTVATGIGGGRAAITPIKKVMTCGMSCSISEKQQHAACGEGRKA